MEREREREKGHGSQTDDLHKIIRRAQKAKQTPSSGRGPAWVTDEPLRALGRACTKPRPRSERGKKDGRIMMMSHSGGRVSFLAPASGLHAQNPSAPNAEVPSYPILRGPETPSTQVTFAVSIIQRKRQPRFGKLAESCPRARCGRVGVFVRRRDSGAALCALRYHLMALIGEMEGGNMPCSARVCAFSRRVRRRLCSVEQALGSDAPRASRCGWGQRRRRGIVEIPQRTHSFRFAGRLRWFTRRSTDGRAKWILE